MKKICLVALLLIIIGQQFYIADLRRESKYDAQEIKRLKTENANKDEEIEKQKNDFWWLFYYGHVSEYKGEYEYYE